MISNLQRQGASLPPPRILMSAVSASIPSAPIVSIATMGGGAGTRTIPGSAPGTPGGKCCENGRPVSTDPLTGQTICSCQYNPGALLMAAGCYPRGMGVGVPGLGDPASVYSSPYATAAMQGLLPGTPGADPTGFYSSMGALQGTAGYYAYDPFGAYPYGNGRKNATRESTQTLKAWLGEHRKNPYPTKGEKIMLAIITKMTLTQVSTWFANARRRLKKENKMTWSPRNRCGEDDDDLDNDDLDDDAAVANDKIRGNDDGDVVNDNDTNNNRDFSDDHSDNDVDILNCGGGPAERDSFLRGSGVDFRKSLTGSHCSISKRLLSEDCSNDINVLDDGEHDSSDASGKDDKVNNSSLGSAFTLVSPSSRVPGLNGHHHDSFSPASRTSPSSELSSPHANGKHAPRHHITHSPKTTSPSAPPKPKIWSVADVVSSNNKSSSDDRSTSSSSAPDRHSPRSPPHQHHHMTPQLNGGAGHIPTHPAFPGGHPAGAPTHSLSMAAARGMGLWNPSVVTSLASMAAAGRYHPYGVPSAGRTPFPNGGLPAGMVQGLIGSHHGGSVGLGAPHISMSAAAVAAAAAQQPTDLRKSAHMLHTGRSSSKSPEGKPMTLLGGSRFPSRDGASTSRSPSPPPVTAFKPVSRSS